MRASLITSNHCLVYVLTDFLHAYHYTHVHTQMQINITYAHNITRLYIKICANLASLLKYLAQEG